MPRVEVKSISAGQNQIFRNVLNYVAKDTRCIQGYIGAANLYLPRNRNEVVSSIKAQIENMRRFYGQGSTRLGLHCIVAFSEEEAAYLTLLQALEIGYFISETEFAECMTYFAVHDHTGLLHIDMLVIPINVRKGYMYGCGKGGWHAIVFRIQRHLLNYMPESAIGDFQMAFEKY